MLPDIASVTDPHPARDHDRRAGDEPAEIDRLRSEVDHLSQQLLGARDAAIGAEIELGVARARVVELEHRLHLASVELDELRPLADRTRSSNLADRAVAMVGPDTRRRAAVPAGTVRRAVGLVRRFVRPAGTR